MTDNPDLVRAVRLLDQVQLRGFTFHWDATGAGGQGERGRVGKEKGGG
ncbi:MAG: hypothetical protein ACRDTE_07460 [Pseudonocardiaceae bacterium]